MKPIAIKLIALLLVACMALPMLVACNGGDDTKETEASTTVATTVEGESEAKLDPAVSKKEYDDEFNALYDHDTFQEGYYFTTEEDRRPGDPMNDAVYERMLNIKEYLGVTVVPVDGGGYTQYAEKLSLSMSADDDTYQLVMTHVHAGVYSLVTSGYLRDFNEFDSLALERPYWNQGIMEDLAIDNAMYLGYNDFCLAFCYLIGFNKEKAEDYPDQIGNLYEQVDNKTWTLDKFISYAGLAASQDGDNDLDADDYYGLSCWAWVPLISFQAAVGVKIVDRDADGELYVAPMKDNAYKITNLDDKLNELIKAESTYKYSPFGGSGPLHIESGHTLFELMNNYELVTATSDDVKVGVLPYPLWEAKKGDYITMSWNGLLGIPTTVEDDDMVGDVIEMLAYYSEDTTEAFYETLLGSKASEAPDDARMLDILWRTQQSDFGLHFSDMGGEFRGMHAILYAIPSHISNNQPNYNTIFNRNRDDAEEKLELLLTAEFGKDFGK